MEFKDYYATLGVAKTATEKEIKQAYRKLARKHHPDVNPGDKSAETKFKGINEAYEVLGDPEKRKKYDELGANWRMYEQAGAGRWPSARLERQFRWRPGRGRRRWLPHDDGRRDARDVRRRRSVLRFLPHLFRRDGRWCAAAGRARGRTACARAAPGARRRAGN